ncbi:HGGxSTG domain-containing protein [Micromonospora sp. CA-248212]|uniref:HGGxSTG domain-containing protein n=1 Tax=Micromonospora sp. CA-248212 TaxID=3239961 RepID=UPI003D90F3B9
MDDDKRCGAKARSTGHGCKRSPVPGATRCRLHGGASPQVLRKVERQQQERALAEAVATYGLALDVSPTEALLDEVKWTAGHVAWLRARVQELEASALSWGVRSIVDKEGGEFPGVDTTEAAAPHVLLDLYQRERKHLVDVCAKALQAGIEERRVRLAESQGALLADVIRRILGDLNLSPEQTALVGEVVPRHLRAVS